jgi:SAM-dependent methyltransferase
LAERGRDAAEPEGVKARTRVAWEHNAGFWDEWMGDAGNDFQRLLVWAPTERLLEVQPGERVLDVACGNGNFARQLAARGASVVGFDFAKGMIERARAYPAGDAGEIEYAVADATSREELAALGNEPFDAAVANMALMDMAEIGPLLEFLAENLRPGGRFVFSVTHPLTGTGHTALRERTDDETGSPEVYSIKVTDYLDRAPEPGVAIRAQPVPQMNFDRALSDLLGQCFAAGLMLDALEEPEFPKDWSPAGGDGAWTEHRRKFPPALVARLRRPH